MKIVSANIGEAKTLSFNGKEVTTGIFKYPVQHQIQLGAEDVVSDQVIDRKYHGGPDKACYLYSFDHYKYWQNLYPDLDLPWGMFGENLTVEGLQESDINIGDIYKIGEALVQATQPRQPCFKLEFRFHDTEIVRKFIDSGFSGVYVRVLKKGNVRVGDTMEIVERKDSISIHKVYELLYSDRFDKTVENAIRSPFIAESCKKDLIKRWGSLLK